MEQNDRLERLRNREAIVELPPEDFRDIGHRLVDQLADFLAGLPTRPVTQGETPKKVRAAMLANRPLPEQGREPASIAAEAVDLLAAHSLFNGHPRFFGYVTSSAMPIGALGDLIASVLNCNVGAWKLAPMATEIEAQTIRWIAEFIGYERECGGLLVSGGNMANFVGFLAARAAAGGMDLRERGISQTGRLRCYCSRETHTWVQKAADMFGLGTDSIRWVASDDHQRLVLPDLQAKVEYDLQRGDRPFLAIGTAGTVSTGAVDPLREIAEFCREHRLWFHVDGAYGGLAARVPGAPQDLLALSLADSVAIDPHKWLYTPIEAGCILVKDPRFLRDAFSYRPSYYNFDTESVNYFDLGPQNSRGFRALKIWLAFQQAGSSGFQQTMADDMALAGHAFRLFDAHPNFEAFTHNLSICTFRYVPSALWLDHDSDETQEMLNRLNQRLLDEIETSGRAFLSNAVIDGRYVLRMCIVNFRTSLGDIEALPGLIAELGAQVFDEIVQHAGVLQSLRIVSAHEDFRPRQ